MRFPGSSNPGNIHHQVPRCQDVLECLVLLVSDFPWIKCEISSYRFAGIPSAPHKIQELFLLKFRLSGSNVRTVELYEPIAFDILLHFFTRQFTAGPFQNLRRQLSGARNRMLGEVGINRDLARIDWQLELRPLLCSFWRHRVPPLRSHLLTPILNLRLAVEEFGPLAITFLMSNPPFFFWRGSPLFRQSVDKLMPLRKQFNFSVGDAAHLPLMPTPIRSPELVPGFHQSLGQQRMKIFLKIALIGN